MASLKSMIKKLNKRMDEIADILGKKRWNSQPHVQRQCSQTPCWNGNDCKYLKCGVCWFAHSRLPIAPPGIWDSGSAHACKSCCSSAESSFSAEDESVTFEPGRSSRNLQDELVHMNGKLCTAIEKIQEDSKSSQAMLQSALREIEGNKTSIAELANIVKREEYLDSSEGDRSNDKCTDVVLGESMAKMDKDDLLQCIEKGFKKGLFDVLKQVDERMHDCEEEVRRVEKVTKENLALMAVAMKHASISIAAYIRKWEDEATSTNKHKGPSEKDLQDRFKAVTKLLEDAGTHWKEKQAKLAKMVDERIDEVEAKVDMLAEELVAKGVCAKESVSKL